MKSMFRSKPKPEPVLGLEYEKQIAETNKILSPNIESVFLLPDSSISMITSSIIREIIKNNGKVDQFLPEQVKIN